MTRATFVTSAPPEHAPAMPVAQQDCTCPPGGTGCDSCWQAYLHAVATGQPWPPDTLAALDTAIRTVLDDLPHRGYHGSDEIELYREFNDDRWTPAEIDHEWVARGLIDPATAAAYHAVLAAGYHAVAGRIAR